MTVFGRSPQGQAAFAHFALILIALIVHMAYFPVRPSEATQQQIVISDVAWAVIAILIFPLGYIGYLLPNGPEFHELQLLWIVLIPLNSCLWGYVFVLMMRRMSQRIRQAP
jgi:hypothetical protein